MNETPLASPWRLFRRLGLVEGALGLTLALLLIHAASYAFLTDDAFISFRYARKLITSTGPGKLKQPIGL